MGDTNPQAPQQGAADPSPHARPPRAKRPLLFGRYELLERYRQGGMAEVWRARRLGGADDEVIALKRILPSFTDEADYLAMFRDEARLAQRLSHPCIVAAYEVGQVDDHPFIALEHVHGQNVAALIRKARERQEPVPAPIALRIALEICRALEHAHALCDEAGRPLEIVHRDVSPTNILLGYDGAVKLIDFGVAKSSDQLMRTQAGLLKGKHGYLSPEQASGEPVDARSDLFSLAICVWEMLAAKRLFLGASDFSSVVRVREAVVPPLEAAGAPEAIERELQRALSRRPSDRHGSATALREALEAAAGEVAPAAQDELAAYLREVFADEIALEASDASAAPLPYEGTGLLDAFDDLEPVSTVSTLAALPEPEAGHQPQPDDDDDDDDEAGAPTDLHRLPTLELVSEPLEPLDTTSDDASGDAVDEGDAILDASSEPGDAAASAAGDEPEAARSSPEEEADEPTRVVAYRSIEHGEVGSTAARDASASAEPAPEPSAPSAPTMPGLGAVEWDDEELSTHLYDGPSVAAHEPEPASDTAADAGSGRPSVAPFSSKPSVAPFASRPSAAPLSSRPPPAIASPSASLAPEAAARHPAPRTPAWLLPALIAAAGVVVFIALSMFQASSPGTIQLTTVPPDARVTFDGRAVASPLSPFVIASVEPGEQHTIEVSREGYRAWSTQLSVSSGQTLELPEVELVPLAPPAAAEAPRGEAIAAEAPPAAAEAPPPAAPEVAPERTAAPARKPDTSASDAPPRPSTASVAAPRARAAEPRSAAPAPARSAAAVPAALASGETGGASDTGMLRINSRPWAQVHVDGRLVGNTPQMALRLSPGRHTVLLVNPELGMRKTLSVQIRRGAVTTQIVDLSQ